MKAYNAWEKQQSNWGSVRDSSSGDVGVQSTPKTVDRAIGFEGSASPPESKPTKHSSPATERIAPAGRFIHFCYRM